MSRHAARWAVVAALGLACVGCGTSTPTAIPAGTVVLTTVMSAATTVTVTESGSVIPGPTSQVTVTRTEMVTETESAAPETTATSETDATSSGSDTAKFGGAPFTWSDGLAVKVSKPAAFTPSETAAGTDQFDKFVVMTVTITNGSKAKYDPSLFYMTVSSGDQEADQVFDSGKGVSGSPSTSVLPGRSVSFKQAFGVKDPKDIVAEVRPGVDYDSAIFTS